MLRVKICGIRRVEDAVLAASLGAWGIGFVFWPGSPRFIDPYRAKKICAELPPWLVPVGVFVDQPEEYVSDVAGLVPLGAVQLHGNESVQTLGRLPHRVIKSVALSPHFDETAIDRLPARVGVLLDAHDPARHGGTGQTIDWSIAAAVARRRKVLLAGGLRPENVGAAVEAVKPFGIDVSSGVEASPGVKDHDRMRALFAAVGA